VITFNSLPLVVPEPATTPSRNWSRDLANLLNDETGQDLIEYALVAALVGLGAVLAMRGLSNKISNAFNTVGNNLTSDV
jgi:pilus assembly protein Flp/PilA